MENLKLPSTLQIGDYADVIISESNSLLGEESILTACKVINVHFGLGSVRYDFEALVSIDNESNTRHVTRVYNIDSAFVHKRTNHHIDGMREAKILKINSYFSDYLNEQRIRAENKEAFEPIDQMEIEELKKKLSDMTDNFTASNFECEELEKELEKLKENKVFDASWEIATNIPKESEPNCGYSDDVLIDLDGKRKNYVVGWYDHDDKQWRSVDDGFKGVVESEILWQYLQLAKYDK